MSPGQIGRRKKVQAASQLFDGWNWTFSLTSVAWRPPCHLAPAYTKAGLVRAVVKQFGKARGRELQSSPANVVGVI